MGQFNTSQIAILQTVTNKYNPGKQVFKLQAITGTKDNSMEIKTNTISKANFMNADVSALPISDVNKSCCIKLEIPKHLTANYPTKYIPQGTRFVVDFQNGDISKPIITGCEF